jgi:SOS response regulatory protein OraA/RecX
MNATRHEDTGRGGVIPLIEALRPDPRSSAWAWVIVNSRRVARAPASAVSSLGIREGIPWTPGLADKIEHAVLIQKARERGVRLLGVRARTRVELIRKLVAGGTPQPIAEAAADSLARDGLLNDADLAADIAGRTGSRASSDAALDATLESRGVDATTRRRAIKGAMTETDRATEAAKTLAKRLSKDLTIEVKWRRLMSSLARRGFDEEVSREAAQRMLGPAPEPEG